MQQATYRLKELEDCIDSVCNLFSVAANLDNTVGGHRAALCEHLDLCSSRLFTQSQRHLLCKQHIFH